MQRSTLGDEARRSGIYHAYSDDNIYEDIVCKLSCPCSFLKLLLSDFVTKTGRQHCWVSVIGWMYVAQKEIFPVPVFLQNYSYRYSYVAFSFFYKLRIQSSIPVRIQPVPLFFNDKFLPLSSELSG